MAASALQQQLPYINTDNQVLIQNPMPFSQDGGIDRSGADSRAAGQHKFARADDWEHYKPIILDYYKERNMPLLHVMRIMKTNHLFNAT